MADKIVINIVYAPQQGPPSKIYENDKGEIWNSATYDKSKRNIGMGWYSIRNPRPNDCILVVEPYCILDRDYLVPFAGKFKHIFTWATKAFTDNTLIDKVVKINHPTYHSFPNFDTADQDWPKWDDRKDEIVIIANNKSSKDHSELYSLRIYLADMLHADTSSKFEVSWYGQIPINKKYYKGKAENKTDILKNAKFSICTENSYDPIYSYNYFTEKMPDVWLSGTVPIYMGCYNINDFVSFDSAYIDLREYIEKRSQKWLFKKNLFNKRLEDFDESQYLTHTQDVKTNLFQSNKLYDAHSYHKVYETIINTLFGESTE